MKKTISAKQVLAVIFTVVLTLMFYGAYLLINDKLNETKFFVNFDSNGGTRVTGQAVKINDKVKEPQKPLRTGYEFEYWTLYGEKYDFNTPVKRHLTLVAKWKETEKE